MSMACRFDLHNHSNCSDGTDTPRRVVERALENGCALVSLTDHDTVSGLAEACAAGRELGIQVLPGVEIDAEWPTELHILGLGVDAAGERLTELMEEAALRRQRRNSQILRLLKGAGADVEPYLSPSANTTTRLHIALALISAGLAQDKSDAFRKWLDPGRPGYVHAQRPSPEDAVGAILDAGGVPVLAHPCHLKGDIHSLIDRLIRAGLRGLEAYYPSSTKGQTELYTSLARQNGLLITCGSDSHGANRPQVWPGCAWQDVPELEESFTYFMQRLQ